VPRCLALLLAVVLAFRAATLAAAVPADAGNLKPEKAPPAYQQLLLPAFDVQTDVPKPYLEKLARQVSAAEQRMYQLFRFSVGFLKGNDRSAKLGAKFAIPGDTLAKYGFKPWIEIRVFQKYEDYADEYFDEIDRLVSIVNKTPIKKETPEERSVRRLTEGVPGAYYMRISDYDGKYTMRRIRAFLGPQTPEEVETQVLHEMGHLFLETYLMEFAGMPLKGQEAEKRGTPAWIGEGIAQLFEINWASSKESQKLKNRNQAMMYEAVKAGDSYPFADFINVTNAHNLMAVAADPLKSTINYCQSYSVMIYMVEKDWARFLQFLENLRVNNFDLNRKTPNRISELYSIQDKSFRDAFGIPLVDLESHWKKHVIESMEKDLKARPALYYWCGEYYLRKKDLDKAEERFAKAVAEAPKEGDGYLGLGRVALEKKKLSEALENLAKAAELNPTEEDAFYYLGVAQLRAGQVKEAIASFEQAVKLYSRFHQAMAQLGEACTQAKDFKRAMEAYDQAYQIQRNNPHYLLNKGCAALFAGENEEAMRNFAVFTNAFTHSGEGPFWYGVAAWRMGQKDLALQKFEESVKRDGNNKMYKLGLERARKGEGITFAVEEGVVKTKPKPKGDEATTKAAPKKDEPAANPFTGKPDAGKEEE
jgi:tetratricopeptide (TPR) repeat protein